SVFEESHVLEGVIANVAYHQKGKCVNEYGRENTLCLEQGAVLGKKEDGPGDRCRGRGNGKPEKLFLLYRLDLRVEAGKSERTTRHIQKSREPPEPSIPFERPHVNEQPR